MISAVFSGARADFLNRSRQPSYLLILLGMSLLTLFFFPVTDANYQTLEINGYRGIYNSAWMGAALATLEVVFLPIICFYLVKNTVERDRNQGAGELIAATPVNKISYLAGKWLSSLFLLLGIGLVMLVATMLVQLWIGEDHHIQLLPLLLPQMIFVMPVMALTAGFALLFEMIPWLRGGLGNIAYFFLWIGLIVNTVEGSAGIGQIMVQMENAVIAYDPSSIDQSTHAGISASAEDTPLKTFIWQGLDYDATLWQAMAVMTAIAVLVFLLSPLFFDRFARQASAKQNLLKKAWWSGPVERFSQAVSEASCRLTQNSSFLGMVRFEFLLLIKGKPVLLYLALIGLAIGQLVVDIEMVITVLIPVSLLLCVLILSPMGQRERQQNTHMLVFSCPSPLSQQLPAMVVAAMLVLVLSVSTGLFRFAIMLDFVAIGSLLIGLVFTVSLAICCGALTGTSRTFEILYTFLWYLGPMQQHSYLDFIGASPNFSQQHHLPALFLGASLVLMLFAIAGRNRQLCQ